ncbi:MAG: hypothetical protein ISS87_00025 [Candidatus Pacebacteria bacterium]|nr:hypothetical protein [Candidatus Paceibacterota bacterium]
MRRKFFIFSIIILTVLLGISFFRYQRQNFSKEIVKLEILGAETSEAGREIEYTVKYKNNGNVTLEDLQLVFEYPGKTLLLEGQEQRIAQDKDDLYPGQEEILKFKARLFGEKGEMKTAKVNLRYRPKNLKPFYESESTFSTKITEVPLTFSFDFPSKVVSGKEIKVSLNYFSNLDLPISDLRIKIQYPYDFEFIQSSPKGIEKNEWEIPLLNKTEGGRIDIFGKLAGDVGGQKTFKAELGIWLNDEFIFLKDVTRGVEIVRPRLVISERINDSPSYIANHGELLHYEIFFRNIGSEPLENLFLVSWLYGPFDLETVNTSFGRLNSSDKSIHWDWRDVPSLRFLAPEQEGKIEFWVNVKEDWEMDSDINETTLKNEILLSQVREEFEIKVNSKLALSQKGFFKDEVFGNSGSIPPKVGETTTYTIIWQAENVYNTVNNVKVRAILPQGVSLTGNISPEQEKSKFTFDSGSREVLWEVGNMNIDGEELNKQKSLAFQVAFTPESNQRGFVATLINSAEISGEDQFTEINITNTATLVHTSLPDDETISLNQGIVQ